MNHKWILLSFTAMTFLLGACAKDRTLDDWKSEHDAENRQKIQSAVGDFRGNLVASADGALISPAQIHLTDCSKSSTVSGTETAICGTLQLQQQGLPMSLSFNQAAVDPNRLEFNAQMLVEARGVVEIRGVVSGDTLTGSVQVQGYPEQSGEFKLVRNGPSGVSGSLKSRTADVIDSEVFKTYLGNPKWDDSVNPADQWTNVRMFISKEQTFQEQNFMDNFMPVRYLDVLFHFTKIVNGHEVDLHVEANLHHMMWDRRTRILSGQTVQYKLYCTEVRAGSNLSWNCTFENLTSHLGPLFHGVFSPMPAAVAGELE